MILVIFFFQAIIDLDERVVGRQEVLEDGPDLDLWNHKRKVANAKKRTMDDHITALRAIVTDNSPHNVYMLQDWAMRYSMKKPYELKVKQYVNSLKLIKQHGIARATPIQGQGPMFTRGYHQTDRRARGTPTLAPENDQV